ncbi:MAG: hypothetical protein AAFR87_16190 [Bacteroidota bacterium]
MAKKKSRIQKFINYTREAFFFPAHLASLAIITTLAALGIFLVPQLFPFNEGLAVSSIILMAGGLELSILSAISRNPRFIRAINAKYQKDIDAFKKTKTLVDYYNELSRESQQRFDKLRNRVKEVRKGFKKMNTTIPSVIENFIRKLNAIELSYARLLYFKDRFPEISNEDAMHETVTEIDKLNQELKNAGSRLRKIKEQRLKILEKRMDNYYKLQENKEVIEEQLQTIEEMVEYIKDQPISVQNTEREDVMIENLLFETEQTQQTMEEIESLMQSEFYPGVVDDFDLGSSSKEFGDSLTE